MIGKISQVCFLLMIMFLIAGVAHANTLWVDASYSAQGYNDGHTWGMDAFGSIQEAMTAAVIGTKIYVAPGRYMENVSLKNWVYLIGAGPETTIIDADYYGSAVWAFSISACWIEGFTLTNGADVVETVGTRTRWTRGSGLSAFGVSNLLVRNCHFENNSAGIDKGGGGIYTSWSSAVIENCLFVNNAAVVDPLLGITDSGGGAIRADQKTVIRNCAFVNNSAISEGGAIYSTGTLSVDNSVFLNNSAGTYIGAARCSNTGDFTGCTFVGNSGGGFHLLSASILRLNNCIIWGNEVNNISSGYIRNCNIEGSSGFNWDPVSLRNLGGNMDTNPLFNDLDGPDNILGTLDDDVRLRWDSPCIDAGANEAISTETLADLDGRMRIWDGNCDGVVVVDMGAYEYKPVVADTTGDCSVDFSDLAFMSEYWLETDCRPCGGADLDMDGDVRLSDLSILASQWLDA